MCPRIRSASRQKEKKKKIQTDNMCVQWLGKLLKDPTGRPHRRKREKLYIRASERTNEKVYTPFTRSLAPTNKQQEKNWRANPICIRFNFYIKIRFFLLFLQRRNNEFRVYSIFHLTFFFIWLFGSLHNTHLVISSSVFG